MAEFLLSQDATKVHDALRAYELEKALIKRAGSQEECVLQISQHMRAIMCLLGLDVEDENLKYTPDRIAKMYFYELFRGLDYQQFPKITLFPNNIKANTGTISVQNITVMTTCEHHFIPIDGQATINYVPEKYLIGLSQINKIVQFFSQRPQIQERLTKQILVALQTLLKSEHVSVIIQAAHYCVKARGVKDSATIVKTTAVGGIFQNSIGYN